MSTIWLTSTDRVPGLCDGEAKENATLPEESGGHVHEVVVSIDTLPPILRCTCGATQNFDGTWPESAQ